MTEQLLLFDANGPVGFGPRAAPDFASCKDLLRHMDRLGIARSLVWSTQARDHHPATGNRALLDELKALGPARDRLVPSLVIAPSMLYERGSAQEFVAIVRAGTTRAVRLFPGTLRFRLRHLEPLIERIAECKPVLFLDMMDLGGDGYTDLLAFAERFPQTPIVCMHGMWPTFFNFSLLDLLRRRPNVLVDNSWLHCRATMVMIVRDFGAERVVFATGPKAHNGASIAHLQYAQIDGETREQIAHRNLEALLGLRETRVPAVAAPDAPQANGLWKKLCAGEPLGVDIVDAHGHLGNVGFWPVPEREPEEQTAAAIQCMDRLGIRTFICSGEEALFCEPLEGNRSLEETAGRFGDRVRGYLAFNPFYAERLVPLMDEFFSRPFFVGLKILCDYWQVPVTDARFAPALRYAQEHRLPILFHTWQGPYDSPAMLKDIVKEYPDASFLLGHSGGGDPGRREAEALAMATENVYLEWCGSFTSRILWEETLKRVGSARVVFGTDGIFHDFAWELGRLLSLDVSEDQIVPILGGNMRRILALRQE